MSEKTIGILGATGYVGRAAVKTILTSTGHNVMLGSRNPEKIHTMFPELASRGKCLQVDVYNRDMLHTFCRRCDIVVNCAGPAKQILDRVAAAALEQGTHYVDVAGYEYLYRQLLQRKQEIEAKKRVFIISAGVFPGLSELFPAYVAERYFEEIDLLELFFAGQGDFSLNAAYDIVCSIEENSGLGMTYCHYGEAKKIDGIFHRTYTLPWPVGKLDTYPILNQEFERIAKRHNIKAAYLYNTYPNKSVLNTFVMIKALEQYKTEEQKRAAAKALTEQFGVKKQEAHDFTMFHLNASGHKDGRPVQLTSNLLFPQDSNVLSGIIVANVARLVIETERDSGGCYFAAEGVQATKLIDLLSAQNIDLKNTFL